MVYFRSLERNVGLPFAFFERSRRRKGSSHGDALSVPLVHQQSRGIFSSSPSRTQQCVFRVSVCVCGAVWSIRWNDDGRRGGGGAVYLFPLNSNLND